MKRFLGKSGSKDATPKDERKKTTSKTTDDKPMRVSADQIDVRRPRSRSSTQSSKQVEDEKAIEFSKTEQESMKRLLEIFVDEAPEVITLIDKAYDASELEDMCGCLLGLAAATGTTYPLIRETMEDEFKRNAKEDSGSIMRGNCLATKLTKKYLQRIGRDYLKEILAPFIHSFEPDKTYEVDPVKITNQEDLEANKTILSGKIKDLIGVIVSPESIAKMPNAIKIITGYFAELANQYAPEQFYPLVGGFLFLRYINPALITPHLQGLDDKQLPPAVYRNMVLITKVLQNLSNCIEFGSKENYMIFMNDFIKANIWKIEKYFKTIVAQATPENATIDPNAATDHDFLVFHQFIVNKRRDIMQAISDSDVREKVEEVIGTLSQYKHISNFLELEADDSQNATLKITVEYNGQVYEHILSGEMATIHDFTAKVIDKASKKMQKKSSKKNTGKVDTTVFGKKIEVYMEQQKALKPNLKIPEFFLDAVNYLLLKGLGDGNLFTTDCDLSTINQLKQQIDSGDRPKYDDREVNVVATLIKSYLASLPVPVIPPDTANDLLTEVKKLNATLISNADSETGATDLFDGLKKCLKQMPAVNRDLLECILRLLWQVSNNYFENMLTVDKLALIFGPLVVKEKQATSILSTLIRYYETLFQEWITKEEEKQVNPIWKQRVIAHQKAINFMVHISNEQSHVICTCAGNHIRAWNTENFSILWEAHHPATIMSMIGVDQHIWCSTEKDLHIFDAKTGALVQKLETGSLSMTLVEHTNRVWMADMQSTTISVLDPKNFVANKYTVPDGIMNLCALEDKVWAARAGTNLVIFDAKTCEVLKEIPNAHKKKINTYMVLDQYVWTGSDDASIGIWRKDNFESVKKIETNSGKVKGLVSIFQYVWCASWDMTVRLYSPVNFELVLEMKGHHTDLVGCVAYYFHTKKNQWLAWTSSYDGTISIWVVPDPKQVANRKNNRSK